MLILIVSAAIYVALYLIYYPCTYAIFDEACYIDLAYALRHGTTFLDQAGLGTLHFPVEAGRHLVSIYPVGNSFFLMPFTFLGSRGVFLYGLVFHLLGFLIFIKVLRKAEIDPRYAVLYLFYPPMFFFSRTLMSDIPAAVFVLLAFYLYQRGKHVGTGAALGLSFVIRYAGVALVPVFLVFALMKKKTEGVKVALGFLPFVLFVLLYNYVTYGGALRTGYPGQALPFDLHRYGMHFLTYAVSLSVLYPLMIAVPFLYKKMYRREVLVSFIVMLVFLLFSSFAFAMYAQPSLKSIVKSSLLGVRYLFPVVPFLLLAYSSVCAKWLKKKGLVAVLIMLVISSVAISRYHQGYLRSGARFRELLYSHTSESSLILCNGEVTELVSIMWGKRNLVLFEDVDFTDLPERDVWVAVLVRLDKGSQKTITRVNSIAGRLDAELVEVLIGVDKEFRLYRARNQNIRVPEYQIQMERRQEQKE
jgi:hypothetical protein